MAKLYSFNATGSLSRRILMIAILLLVIPLFLQSFFLYWQEYRQKVGDTLEELRVLAKERVHLIEEMIHTRWAILADKPQSDSPCLDLPVRDPICQDANVKQLYIQKINQPQEVEDQFVILNKKRTAILVGQRGDGFFASAIAIPFSQITMDLGLKGDIQISLVDEAGNVLEGSNQRSENAKFLSVTEPIPATSFSLRLELDEAGLKSLHLEEYIFRFLILLFFVGVIGGFAVYLFIKRMNRPLKSLAKAMQRVSEGAEHVRYTPDRMGFEINQLGLQFNETMDLLLKHAQSAEKERLKREKLAEELRIGHEIQASLVPSQTFEFEGLEIGTGYLASKEVNGDFYDLFKMKDGRLFMVICDTAGKGVGACLYSLGLRSMFRALAQVSSDLEEIVLKANDLYYLDAHETSMFSTAWIGIYDPEAAKLSYCSQGHPPALLTRKEKIQELGTEGIALGAQKLDALSVKTVSLKKGDLLVLYTDGILEAQDPDGTLFGKKRLSEFLLRKQKEESQRLADYLIEEIHLFSQGTLQHDDRTLVVLRLS